MIFNSIFGINIAKEVKTNGKYLDAIFSRAHRAKFMPYEVLLSLEYKLLKQYPDNDFTKFISTIMMGFYSGDILQKDFILGWKDGSEDEIFGQCVLWDEVLNTEFKGKSADFLKYLENHDGSSDDDESGDDDDSEDEDDD